jgi:PAS domain-containing protein
VDARVHPHDRPVLKAALNHMAQTRAPYQDTLRCVHPDGMIVWVSFKIAAMVVDGKIYGYVGTVDDITHVRKSVMALRESEARLRTIADTLPAMVAYIDAEQVYRFHNLAYEREFNRTGTTVLGRTILETMGRTPRLPRTLCAARAGRRNADLRGRRQQRHHRTHLRGGLHSADGRRWAQGHRLPRHAPGHHLAEARETAPAAAVAGGRPHRPDQPRRLPAKTARRHDRARAPTAT